MSIQWSLDTIYWVRYQIPFLAELLMILTGKHYATLTDLQRCFVVNCITSMPHECTYIIEHLHTRLVASIALLEKSGFSKEKLAVVAYHSSSFVATDHKRCEEDVSFCFYFLDGFGFYYSRKRYLISNRHSTVCFEVI